MSAVMEQLDIFSFTFDQSISEERIQEALKEVIKAAKSNNNTHSFNIKNLLNMSVRNVLSTLEERGYVKIWNEGRMCHLKYEYRDWHDPNEVAENYRANALDMIAKGANAYDILTFRNSISGQGIDEAVEQVRTEIFMMLGIEHARKDRKALGHAIDKDRAKNKKLIKVIFDETRGKSWLEVEDYFKNTLFIEKQKYVEDKLLYTELMPHTYKAMCVAQAESIEDIKMLIPFFGCHSAFSNHDGKRTIAIY